MGLWFSSLCGSLQNASAWLTLPDSEPWLCLGLRVFDALARCRCFIALLQLGPGAFHQAVLGRPQPVSQLLLLKSLRLLQYKERFLRGLLSDFRGPCLGFGKIGLVFFLVGESLPLGAGEGLDLQLLR